MAAITSAVSNFMYRRNAERVETEEPDEEEALGGGVSESNSITEEDGEEGEFVGTVTVTSTTTRSGSRSVSTGSISAESSHHTPMLETLPDDEDVNTDSNINSNSNIERDRGDEESPGSAIAVASGAEPSESTAAQTTSTSASTPRTRRVRGFTLRDLEEEREIVQRRTGACVLLSSFVLLRLWIQAVMTGDFGLLLLCLVFTSWTARFVRYTRDREEELNRMINDWDENAEEEPAINDARLTRMSFQSQLALAIMQSQIQLMEGGYGHPDGGESRNGVGDGAKDHWDRFEYKSTASLTQRGDYGSVADQKDCASKGDDTKNADDDEPTCSICLCEYEKGEKLVSLPCKHVFHDDCITSWTDNNTRCPLCNSDLESVAGDEVV